VTIILSVVTADYAVQVSDRLLTRKLTTSAGVHYEPWDEAANKSVIVLGRDGLFAMGYTGPVTSLAPRPTIGLRNLLPVRSWVPTRSGPSSAPFG